MVNASNDNGHTVVNVCVCWADEEDNNNKVFSNHIYGVSVATNEGICPNDD